MDTTATSTAAQPQRTNSSSRGFASMDPARVREIASQGGKAAHAQGRAHQWNPETAREAGRKGGQARRTTQQKDLLL